MIDIDSLLHPQTGFVAFVSYLWGNGAISRFIARLNQFLLLFSFVATACVYIWHNKKRSAIILVYTMFALFIAYIVASVWFVE